MKNQEAKFILGAYRPDGRDAGDPAFTEALAQAETQLAADGIGDQAPLLLIQLDVGARGKDRRSDPDRLRRQHVFLVHADL